MAAEPLPPDYYTFGDSEDSHSPTFDEDYDLNYWTYLTFGDIASLIGPPVVDITLLEDGCRVGDGHNCTAVCTDPDLLFANSTVAQSNSKVEPQPNRAVSYNVYNCLYYPYISNVLSRTGLNAADMEPLRAMAERFQILPNASTELIQEIVSVQNLCYVVYCATQQQEDTGCVGFGIDEEGEYTYSNASGPGIIQGFPDWSTISDPKSMNVNGDIGGIGVSIAYMIQFSVIMTAWLLLLWPRLRSFWKRCWTSMKAVPTNFTHRVPSRASQPCHICGSHKSEPLFSEQALELLGEFHKAQCFLLIPLDIAIIVGISVSASVISSTSYGQFERNMAYAQAVTQGGVVFVTATLFFLQVLGRRVKVLPCLLTVAAVVMGVAAWCLSYRPGPPEELLDADIGRSTALWVPYCGVVSPASYNGETWSNMSHRNEADKRLPIIAFSCCVLLGLLIQLFITKERPKHLALPMKRRWHDFAQRRPAISAWITRSFLGLTELGLLICLCFFVYDYTSTMTPTLPTIDQTFSVGQLLALGIWASTLVDACYLLEGRWRKRRARREAQLRPLTGDDGKQLYNGGQKSEHRYEENSIELGDYHAHEGYMTPKSAY